MAEQEQSRSEPATPFKLDEARKRGVVARSLEANSFVAVLTLLGVLAIGGPGLIRRQLAVDSAIFGQAAGVRFEVDEVSSWLSAIVVETMSAVLPLLVVVMLVAILANVAQTGPVASFFPIKPDFDRINPVSGLRRLFSLRVLFEAAKNIVKLVLFSIAAYVALKGVTPQVLAMPQIDLKAYPALLLELITHVGLGLALVMLVVALLDLLYTRWDYARNLMMSRRELRDEIKRREGDPRIKTRIRELQRELLKRSKSLSRVKEADVLITNPTHLAVALHYRRGQMTAPRVIAKGAGELAESMKAIARRSRVPVLRNPQLAQWLFRKVDIEEEIPESGYAEVAKILAWAYTLKHGQAGPRT